MPDVDDIDAVVAEYDRTFGGILVEGIDLAAANRLSFYGMIHARTGCASASRRSRWLDALNDQAVLFRDRLRRTAPPSPPLPAPGPPRALFFFEAMNPSVHATLRPALEEFSPAEARVAFVQGAHVPEGSAHETLVVKDWIPRGMAHRCPDLPAALRTRQREARMAILRRESLRTWLLRMSLRTADAARAFTRIYDAFPTTVLVTASDTSFWGYCATVEARRRGIPSVTLQHGMMVGEAGYVPVVSSLIAAWGEASARWLRERGVPPEKIVVTGAPRLDGIVSGTRCPREVLAAGLGVDPGRRWVVLATNPIPFERNAALLATARKGVIDWGEPAILLVKLHPSEDPAPYRSAIEGDPNVVVVPHGKVDLYDLLAAADAVLTFHSSVGLEAMAFDRPVVSLEAFGEENPLPYARTGAAAAARSTEELARALREDVADGVRTLERRSARARYVRDNLLATDGKSSRRVRDLVVSLAPGRRA